MMYNIKMLKRIFNKIQGFVVDKKKVIFGVLILCLIIGGVFYLKNKKIVGSPDDYTTIQENGARFVVNERAGLKVRIPDNWIEKKMDIMEGSMVFYSPDAEGYRENKISPPLKKGCVIEVAVGYEKISFEDLQKQLGEKHKRLWIKSDEFEMIEINDMSVLKNEFEVSCFLFFC